MEKLRRIFAIISVIFIVAIIILMFFCGLTGSKYFWGVLFLTFFIPCILWVFMWFYKVISNRDFHEDIGMDNPLNDKNIDESDLENH